MRFTLDWRLVHGLVVLLACLALLAGCAGGGGSNDNGNNPSDPRPVASLAAFPDTGAAPLTVNLDGSGSWAKNGSALTYDWDLNGDGVYEKLASPNTEQYTFDTAGSHAVGLRVVDSAGNARTATVTVHVTAGGGGGGGGGTVEPVASLLAYPKQGTAPLKVTLDASGSWARDGGKLTYQYDFNGDGTYDQTSNAYLVEHAYDVAGTYSPKLKVTDGGGHSSTAAAGAVQVAAGGGGGGGGSDDPVASLLAYPKQGTAPLKVTLDASGSWAKDGGHFSYQYDFDGDGTYDQTSSAYVIEHTYSTAGTYSPKLKVTDSGGHSATAAGGTVQVAAGSGGGGGGGTDEPVASLLAYPRQGTAPLKVTLDASGSWARDGGKLTYQYDFNGDGTYDQTSSDYLVEHTYDAAGTFTPKLKVTDSGGHSATAAAGTVQVTTGGGGGGDTNGPVAVLIASPSSGRPPLSVTFNASFSVAMGSAIESYDWDFDDDGTFELLDGGPTQQQTYTAEGVYIVTVRVTDHDGSQSTAQFGVVVSQLL